MDKNKSKKYFRENINVMYIELTIDRDVAEKRYENKVGISS